VWTTGNPSRPRRCRRTLFGAGGDADKRYDRAIELRAGESRLVELVAEMSRAIHFGLADALPRDAACEGMGCLDLAGVVLKRHRI
jgi:hypothetical protein